MGNKKRKKGKSSEGKDSKRKADELKKEIEDYQDRLLRLQADFDNYKKHLDREKEEFTKSANRSLIKDLLGVLDDSVRAVKGAKKQQIDKKFVQGIELSYRNLFKILEQRGLRPIDAVGKKFDPYYHEVLLQEESKKEEGTILEELQTGYLLNNKVIRHAKVKVAKN